MKSALAEKKCTACKPGTPALTAGQINLLLPEVSGWQLQNNEIARNFDFKNFYQTMAFVNAVAWVANQQDHHPDLEVSYNKCKVRFSTHSVGGLSENDFICAAKVNAVMD